MPLELRSFDDIDAQRNQIYSRSRERLGSLAPLSNATHSLEIVDTDYDDGDFSPGKDSEKRAILNGASLHRPLYGTVRLRDAATQKVVDERRMVLARVPHLNSRGLFIRKGVIWALRNQERLRPGVYRRKRADGASEAQFNVKPGSGRGFRVMMEPETGLFKLQVGQSTTRLYPVLRALGISDDEIKEGWGEDLYNKNFRPASGHDEQDLRKLVEKLGSRQVGHIDADMLPDALRDIMARTELDPETTELTMGEPIKHVEPRHILQAANRVLRIARDEDKEDNRDGQTFQSVHSAEDLISERLANDQVKALRRLLWKASKEGRLPDVPGGLLDKNIDALFQGTGLAAAVEDTNPFDIYDTRQSITRLGSGGISSEQAVSRDARGVQSSYLGVIDAGRGPECFDGDTEVLTADGWVQWRVVNEQTRFAVANDDGYGFERAYRLIAEHYTGRMYGYTGPEVQYLVTPSHRMFVQRADGRWRFMYAAELHEASLINLRVRGQYGESISLASQTNPWTKLEWNDMVYCATVPGSLLLVRRNGCTPFWTGNSGRLGLDLRVTDGALKGSDNRLYTRVIDARTGKLREISAAELSKHVVTFPGEMDRDTKRVPVVRNDEVTYATKDEIDFIIPHPGALMSRATAMIPFPESVKGQRLLMGSRFTQQALPLREPEAPLVQTADEKGHSLHERMGTFMGAQRSPVEGVITKVTPDAIHITTPAGEKRVVSLYNNYPAARKTVLHNTPMVQKGDYVRPGALLAKSNFTDDKGVSAIGRNLRVAFMAAEGSTVEDAWKISESAAKKLMSETMYKSDLDLTDIHSTKKSDYTAVYPGKYTREQLDKLDDQGTVMPGTEVKPGDPLILAIANKAARGVGAVMQSARSSKTDRTLLWEHKAPGVVTDVSRTRGGVKVFVKSYDISRSADKLANRFGGKGVIGDIVPDEQMPVDEQGRPIEVIANSLGIISRVNPGALAEALLGKVAEKTGKPYVIQGFSGKDVADFAIQEALRHGVVKEKDGKIIDTETLTDPRDGRKIPGIFTGVTYLMKLHHMAEGKLSARDTAGYTTEGLPARGGPEGSKRIGLLDTFSLVSAGATDFLKEAKLIRGQRNDDYWRGIKFGEQVIEPTVSFANEQFKSLLKAAGVSLREKGTRTQLAPMLDADVDAIAQHEIENSSTYDFETMRPIPGGLFDLAKTGGADGNRFSKIILPKKIPHPLFVDPIQRILNLTGKQLEAVLAGKEELAGKTGPEAVEEALRRIDIDGEMNRAKEVIRNGRATQRDTAVKRLNYLAGLKKLNIAPDALMISKIPVLPPKYRPIVQARGADLVHDLNYLYHDLLEARDNVKQAKEAFGDDGEEYLTMFHTAQAVAGVRDPISQRSVDQGVKGVLRYAIGVGDSPKYAAFQRKVIGTAVDTVGRGTITADKNLGMDEIGLPEEMAWTIYRPFVIRRLARSGIDATVALKEVSDRSKRAEKALEEEMQERPVVYNRAPALHRYAYTAAWPKIRKDDAIGMPYHTLKSINGDYDGDSINIHALATAGSVKDATEKMLPSKNLFFTGNFQTHYEPVQDYIAGMYLASIPDETQDVVTFATEDEAKRAYARGVISARTPIRILKRRPA